MGLLARLRAPARAVFPARFYFLVGCFVLGLSNAELDLYFPGRVLCFNDSIRITLPKLIEGRTWQNFSVVGLDGKLAFGCEYSVDELTMTASKNCIEHQGGKDLLRISLLCNMGAESRNITYDVVCENLQGDEAPLEPMDNVQCMKDFMSVAVSRTLPQFDEQTLQETIPFTWYLEVYGEKLYSWQLPQARQHGYSFQNDEEANKLVVAAPYNATGVQLFQQDGRSLYLADLALTIVVANSRISVETAMMCFSGPVTCNGTHVIVILPSSFRATLDSIVVNRRYIPLSQLKQNGITLDTNNGISLYLDQIRLQGNLCAAQQQRFTSAITLSFLRNERTIPLSIFPVCECIKARPEVSLCTASGTMDVEVFANQNTPNIDLDTVQVRDATCKPLAKFSDRIRFQIPLGSCGTTALFEGDRIIYENEVRAQYVLNSRISRDSEFRLTVKCYYRNNAPGTVIANVATPSPLVSLARSEGPLSLVLDLFPDDSYAVPYNQYPVVKLLQEPVYLEVKLLNRNDLNIELKLDDCWATALKDPASLPRWNIVVDGCDFENDNYRTVFHPVGLGVSYPSYRKRFEVKTFAFVAGNQAIASLVYFHCSAVICNLLAPDSVLCSKRCLGSARNRRDVSSYGEISVSLPGPVIYQDDPSMKTGDNLAAFGTYLEEGAWSIVAILVCFVLVCLAIFKWRAKEIVAN